MRALYALDLAEDLVACGLDVARDLLARLGATVDLLYVDPLDAAVWLPEETGKLDWELAGGLERRDAELVRQLERILGTWPPERRGAVAVAREVRPADEIVARASGHELVVVGTHARHGVARPWLGSVAEKVVRTSPVPVLVTRASPRSAGEERVLAAIDVFEEGADALAAEAGRWAARLCAPVDLAYVVAPIVAVDPVLLPYGAAWAQALAELERAARERLSALVAAVPEDVRGSVRITRGEAAACIGEWSREYLLVLVGTHQRRGFGRLWLGSVAERAVRSCRSPVLVLPRVGDGER